MEANINPFIDEVVTPNKNSHFFPFNKPVTTPLSLRDVIHTSDELIINAIKPSPTGNIEALLAYYRELPAINLHEWHGKKSSVLYPIHVAARDGDCDAIIALVNQGYDVNAVDKRNISPLHVAALFGQNEAVETLLSLNANIDAKGYEDHTPLHFALLKGHYEVANTLVLNGAEPGKQDQLGNNGFTLLVEKLPELLYNASDDSDLDAAKTLQAVFELTENMITLSKEPLYFNIVSEVNEDLYLTPIPLAMILQVMTSNASTNEYANQLIKLTHLAEIGETSNVGYVQAKDLLHQFPTGELYSIALNDAKDIWMLSEGHFGVSTSALAANSINAFIESDSFDNTDPLKADIFSSLLEIYNNAKEFSLYSSTQETADKAISLYHDGVTLLLPSGWDGHFIDIILSKDQLVYGVANSGERYRGESPDYVSDPAGINFYRLYEPDGISQQFIYNILNNSDRTFLEFENAYEYGVFDRIEEISRDDQQFGNCGWESHRNAVEGLIFIELLNRNISSSEAKVIAADYYQEWDNFHGNFVIDTYLNGDQLLPLEALFDIFNQIHLKDNYTEVDHAHAQKIANAMISDRYLADFKSWLSDSDNHELSDKLMLNILKQQHGIDINHFLLEDNTSSEIADIVQQMDLTHLVDVASPIAQTLELTPMLVPVEQPLCGFM